MASQGTSARRFQRLILVSACLLYLGLCMGYALTQRPWSDEGWFASASYTLATEGEMATKVFKERPIYPGIERRTYWVMPLYLVLEAAWYRVVGFSLFTHRFLTVIFGLLGAFAWYVLVKHLWAEADAEKARALATLTFVLVLLDYFYICFAAFGRMDMMCAALGFAGLAAYMHWRERHWLRAVGASHTLVCASGMTHFLGVMPLLALCYLTWKYDRAKINLKALGLAAIPYLIAAMAWGLYIMQAPDDFLGQFKANAANDGRLGSLFHPLKALTMEIRDRYLVGFGLGDHSVGTPKLVLLKVFIILLFLAGVAGLLLTRQLRQQRNVRTLLVMLGIYFIVMTILDGQKMPMYFMHILPIYAACLAVWLSWLWTRNTLPKWLMAGAVSGLLMIQLGGVALKIKQNSYQRRYAPAVAYLRAHKQPNSLVVGSADLGFGLGFTPHMLDDNWLGYANGKQPDFIVMEEIYQSIIEGSDGHRARRPAVHQHVQATLKHYELVYDHAGYRIYRRLTQPGQGGN
jgi:4-amino-4-deoxy-L-arabinose transferase-like glycosyltransferase